MSFVSSTPVSTITISLTERQRRWLDSRGGRSMVDVVVEEDGQPFVWMGSGTRGEEMKVYIPSHQALVDDDIAHYRGS